MTGQTNEIALRDAQAEDYDRFFINTRSRFGFAAQVATVLHHLALRKDDAILDLGCGTGLYALEAARCAARVVALDFSDRSISLLKAKAHAAGIRNIEANVADATEWIPPIEAFSKAMAVEVLQHVPGADQRIDVLRKVAHALRPGGRFVCVVYRYGGWIRQPKPKEDFDHAGTGLYRFAFDRHDVEDMFARGGLTLCRLNGLSLLPRKLRKRMPVSLRFVEILLSRLPFTRELGDYYIAVGTK